MAIQNFHLANFMQNLRDGVRPNQFYVDLALPAALQSLITNVGESQNKIRFLCKASSIPASTVGEIAVPFRGQTFKLPGDRTFQDWEITVLNDKDFLLRDMFEQWSDMTVGHSQADRFDTGSDARDFMGSGEVNQLDRNGNVLKTYSMIGAWPGEISAIPVDMTSTDSIEEFTVSLKVQWWESRTTRNNSATSFGESGSSIL